MVAIAKSVFQAGPKDNADIIDVYSKASTEVRNNLTSKLSAFGSDLSATFEGALDSIAELGHRLGKGEVDIAAAAERIRNAVTSSRGDLVNLTLSVQNAIFGELTGKVPGTDIIKGVGPLYDQVKIITGEANYVFNGDRKSTAATLNFISDLTGKPVFKSLDMGAEAALVGGLIGKVSSWGAPELVDTLLEGRDADFKHGVLSRNGQAILQNSTIRMLEHYVDLKAAESLSSQTPDFGKTVLATYKLPAGSTPDNHGQLSAQLTKVMDAFSPTWLNRPRGQDVKSTNGNTINTPRMVQNLGALAGASEDAVKVLMSDPGTRAAVMVAQNFPTEDVIALAKKTYPLIGIA